MHPPAGAAGTTGSWETSGLHQIYWLKLHFSMSWQFFLSFFLANSNCEMSLALTPFHFFGHFNFKQWETNWWTIPLKGQLYGHGKRYSALFCDLFPNRNFTSSVDSHRWHWGHLLIHVPWCPMFLSCASCLPAFSVFSVNQFLVCPSRPLDGS